MLRPLFTILTVLAVSSTAILGATMASHAPSNASPEGVVPIGAQIWAAGSESLTSGHARSATHPQPLPLPPADLVGAAREALTVELHGGRTVAQWTDLSAAENLLSLPGETRDADLATEVLRLSSIVGVPQDAAVVQASADAVSADLRAPFASLVATVADAYEAQAPLAGSTSFTDAQRDASLGRATAILGAMNAFRATVGGLPADADGIEAPRAAPLFRDPAGLVILGGLTDDAYYPTGTLKDPVLLVDLGGNDDYFTTAGGACGAPLYHTCNLLAVSVLLDVDGDDEYRYDGAPNAVQGAGSVGGLGILADVQGDDVYASKMTRTNSGPFGVPLGYTDGGAQGMSNAGVGILVDGLGNDVYRADVQSTQGRSIWDFAQGWGGNGGLAIASDGAGDDWWVAYGLGLGDCSRGCGFQGVYTNGVGFFGGIGVMTDTGLGNDHYKLYDNATTTDFYSVGFGAFGGTGIFYEDGGNDDYVAGHFSTSPFIVPLLNCAFGTGSLGGAGIFLEMGGDDVYMGVSGAPGKAYTMNEGFGGIGAGYGLFVDLSGDDGHFMVNYNAAGTGPNTNPQSDTFGRGVIIEHSSPLSGIGTSGDGGPNRFGHYLDLGGHDTYVGARPSADNAAWSGGADQNLVPSLAMELVLG